MNTETNGLRQSNEPLHCAGIALSDFIEDSPYPTHLKDAQTNRYINCNLKFSEYIGMSTESIQGLTIEDVFNQRQWEEAAQTALFYWWRKQEPDNLRRLDAEVQKTQQRTRKQRLSITSTGLLLFKDTVKTPVLSLDRKKVIAILTQSRDITLQCNLFNLLNTYKRYYADQEAVQNMLVTLDIDGYFSELPNIEEIENLLALCYGLSDQESHTQSLQERMSADHWHEILTRLRMIPIETY